MQCLGLRVAATARVFLLASPLILTSALANGADHAVLSDATATGQLTGHTAPQVLDGTATRVSHYDPTQKLRLTIAIQPPHLADEEKFLKELTTRGSANYHKFLSADDWNTRFAPAAADEQKVVNWATGVGFTVTARFANRLLIMVEAPAATIETALGVTINNYRIANEVDFANDRDPVVPASVAGLVYSVQGLNNIQREHSASPELDSNRGPDYVAGPAQADGPSAKKSADASERAFAMSVENTQATSLTNGALNPTALYSSQAYNFAGLQAVGHCCNPGNKPAGSPPESSIAIAAFGGFLGSDIARFGSAYPYLAYQYNVYYINGTPTCTGGATTCPSQETTQDLEWAIATSNSFDTSKDTSHVYVYIGATQDNGTFTALYNQMLSDGFARVMTTSWTCTEVYSCSQATMDARHAIFNAMVGQGWTLIAAAGDRGSSDDCDFESPAHVSVAYPASDPDFVAAGGTQLQVDSSGNWLSESGWQGGTTAGSCASEDGGSGGGASSYYNQPSWQNAESALGNGRLVPDISLNAYGTPQNVFFNGSMVPTQSGTSLVAPELAGFFAQENAYLLAIGSICGNSGSAACAPLGNPNSLLYTAATDNNLTHSPYYDTTSGCNSNDVTSSQGLPFFCAGSGYDQVTGWGSANMMQLAWALNDELISPTGSPKVTFTGPGANSWYNQNETINWKVQDSASSSGIAGTTSAWDSIPADPASEPSGGVGNSFYAGPASVSTASGCFNLQSGSCGSGVSQGCHTVHVEGWNNLGQTTGDSTYGPVCLDTTSPTVSASLSPSPNAKGWNDASVNLTLNANDAGGATASGIANVFYSTGTQCSTTNLASCAVYGNSVSLSSEGTTTVTYFAEDNAGNFSSVSSSTVKIDLTAPQTTANLSGTASGGSYSSAVQFTLSANDNLSGVANTYYALDGGSQVSYNTQSAPSITVSTPGAHSLQYWSVDVAGNVETTNATTFTIVSATTTTLTSSPNPSQYGQSVSITATVTPTLSGAPTGSVTFYNGSSVIGAGTLSGGKASITTSALPAGQSNLQASYGGATYYTSSNSATLVQTVNQGAVQLTPSSIAFPQTVVGATATSSVTVTNNGSGNLSINSVSVGGSSVFSQTNNCVGTSIAPNNACTIQVTFTPTAGSAYTGSISIIDNAPGGAQTVTLSGSGVNQPVLSLSPNSLSFQPTYVSKTSSIPVTLSNTGTGTLKISSVTFTGSNASVFTRGSGCVGVSIAAGATCTLNIKFTPTTGGSFSSNVNFISNGLGSPQTLLASGTGVFYPTVSYSPSTVTFPSTKVASHSTMPITISNTGKGNLTITSITNTGPHPTYFSDAQTCVGVVIAPASSCTMQITFTPAAKGSFSATMNVADNAAQSKQYITLKGTGK